MAALIKRYVSISGGPVALALPAGAVVEGVSDAGGPVGSLFGCFVIFRVNDPNDTSVIRTFDVVPANGEAFDDTGRVTVGVWFQRTAAGVVTPYVVYEVV